MPESGTIKCVLNPIGNVRMFMTNILVAVFNDELCRHSVHFSRFSLSVRFKIAMKVLNVVHR